MNKISIINKEQLSLIIKFIDDNANEFNYFKKIGWNKKNIENQLGKDNNYSLAYYEANNLAAVLIGEKIKTLVSGFQIAGSKNVNWNATNNQGQPVSAGVYLYTIEAGDFRQTKKMILLK